MKIIGIVGARPNFMKMAPIMRALAKSDFEAMLCHTGQHYDDNMSKVFFDDLELPRPDIFMGVGSGSHAKQTAKIMTEFEDIVLKEKPDLVMVVGDVNSTIACSLVCAKLMIPIAHVEAGLRSWDREMPEEINRMVTDILADLLFTTSAEAEPNLLREGVAAEKIHFTGNVMIDSLMFYLPKADRLTILDDLELKPQGYGLVTLHRPSNVDDPDTFRGILDALGEAGSRVPLIWPMHPRTRKMIESFGIDPKAMGLRPVEPLGYLEFMKLMKDSRLVMTDSGGIQEETTVLGIPCLTLRENTERPITCDIGTNTLVGVNPDNIRKTIIDTFEGEAQPWQAPPLWDGHAAERIVEVLKGWAK
ncbi:MAG: UDP-N-acetylglucosamine 2-epimerase (non-hydrolyzing) [bacterium]|nr:UDP-N-acetylglucosamine 2-epimerase (non-hydrolyzing) [bacterium]